MNWVGLTSLALALSAQPGPASAQGFLSGLFGGGDDAAEVEIIDPFPYSARFTITGGSGSLESALKGASSVWSGRERPASGAAGLIASAQDDYRSLLGTLYQRGHYSGVISVTINGVEAAELPLTQGLRGPANVEIRVDPGPAFVFGQVGFSNPAPEGFGPPPRPGSTAQDVFKAGEPARADVIAQAGEEEVENWRWAGHPKAEVASRDVVADHARNRLDARVNMDPGPSARFGKVTVAGDTGGVDRDFVIYMADLPEGGRFTPEAIEEANQRLSNLRVFRAVRFNEGEAVAPDGTLPIEIETTPRKPRRWGVGATVSTTEGLGLEGFWLHRQLGRRAERLRFEFSVGGIGTEGGFEDYDYELGTSFIKPGFLHPDNSLISGLKLQHLVFDDYTENTAQVDLGIERRFDERLTGDVFASLSYSEIEDDGGTEEYLTFALPIGATYDARDVPLDAHEGFYLDGELRPFHEFEFETTALKAQLEGRAYFELVEDSTVLALRAKAGTIIGGELSEISPSETFFTGGGGSIRGYGFRSNGLEVDGVTVGGRSVFEVSAEIRQQVTDSIGIVGFADGGVVSADTFPGADGDFRFGAGAGVRYDTTLGPLRLDVAVPIDPRPGDPDFALYIGIGQAF